jgi:hypothetical protein
LGAEKTRSQCLDKLDNQKMLDAKRAAREAPQRPVHIILVLVQDALLGAVYDLFTWV